MYLFLAHWTLWLQTDLNVLLQLESLVNLNRQKLKLQYNGFTVEKVKQHM
jgi:hypothetical protein